VATLALEVDGKIFTVGLKLLQFDRVRFIGVLAEGFLEGLGPDLVGVDVDTEDACASTELVGVGVLEVQFLEDASEVGQPLGACCYCW
jgi:hypothetical protein